MSGSGGNRNDGYPSASPVKPPASQSEGAPGGSGGGEGEGGGVMEADACNIVQRAPLNSPRPKVIATISVADVLHVVLNEAGVRPVLEVHAPTGVAGALTHCGHLAIIQCIRAGHAYGAVVLAKSGGAVEVRVQPA